MFVVFNFEKTVVHLIFIRIATKLRVLPHCVCESFEGAGCSFSHMVIFPAYLFTMVLMDKGIFDQFWVSSLFLPYVYAAFDSELTISKLGLANT